MNTTKGAPMEYLPIEDHGIIGDMHTVALVGKDGSIDWMCFPHFDSPSLFAAILDHRKGGFFRIPSTVWEKSSILCRSMSCRANTDGTR